MKPLRGARTDLVIATIALLVSGGATLSSIYQTHVIANQLSASVWPYLSIESSLGSSAFRLAATNDGLGPALIRSATLFVDGRPVPTYRKAIAAVLSRTSSVAPSHTHVNADFQSVDSTSVIRASDTHKFIDVSGIDLTKYGDLGKRVSLELCYCSLQDECWDVRSGGDRKARARVAACTSNDGIAY